ncbi:MAG: hypothetical protein E7147_02390 [Rikenellaceae bacterium]|nr:hypothetical protein [Rikenellaceae bacterium]
MKRVLSLSLLLFIVTCTAYAKVVTVVTLKNGGVFEGTKIEENDQIVRLEFANRDVRVFYKSDISSISTFDKMTPEEQLIAESSAAAQAKEVAKAEKRAKTAAQKESARIKRKEDAIKYRGYRQFIDLSYSYCSVTDFLGVSYIGGYRFNPYIFLGLGTGINFSLATPDKNKLHFPFCRPTTVNVPIYIHCKANFTKSNWSPYASVSIGGRVSKKVYHSDINYNQSGFFGDISFGVDRSIAKKLSLYCGLGYKIESFLYAKHETNDTTSILVQGNKLLHGFSLHVGLSF